MPNSLKYSTHLCVERLLSKSSPLEDPGRSCRWNGTSSDWWGDAGSNWSRDTSSSWRWDGGRDTTILSLCLGDELVEFSCWVDGEDHSLSAVGDWVLLSAVKPDWGGSVDQEVDWWQDTGAVLVVGFESGFEATGFCGTWSLKSRFGNGVVGGIEVESGLLLVYEFETELWGGSYRMISPILAFTLSSLYLSCPSAPTTTLNTVPLPPDGGGGFPVGGGVGGRVGV